MLKFYNFRALAAILALGFVFVACHDNLDEPPLNVRFNEGIDYSISDNITLPVIGAYADFYSRGWETIPLLSVRGDDVNHGGEGDQQPFADTDRFIYNKDYWMYNSLWQLNYSDIYNGKTAMEQVELYRQAGASDELADQYVAEVEVLNAFLLYYLTEVWGEVFIPETGDPSDLLVAETASREDVLKFISEEMARVASQLPTEHPADRADIPGGVNRYTALAIKARADQALGDFQAVADATSEIINSGVYQLSNDFYNLFKIPGKLDRENLLELQYSDFGQPAGDENFHLYNFYGPQGWTPAVEGAGSGWGFYEPSLKYIKFMLDRGETIRLETSVLFTDRGIAELTSDPDYQNLPAFVNNTTRDGDRINDYARAKFASGKHYLPSNQLTPGRTRYSSNKNYICIRYAEVLLMHAEALTRGAGSSAITATEAVNLVRERASLPTLSSVTTQDVMDEKYAELAMEWGIRYYDLIRTQNFDELDHEGRDFNPSSDIFLPYPQNQVDLIPGLSDN